LHALRERLVASLRDALPGIVFNTPLASSLPTTLNFSVPGLSGKELLDVFDAAGVRVSSGSACSSAKAAPSYVLEAMQLDEWRCSAAVRMSFGPAADDAFIDAACERIGRCGQALRVCGLIPASGRADSAEVACGAVESGEGLDAELSPSALKRFLIEQPDALLVDVREPWEYEVGKTAMCGREVLSIPLSRLPSRIDGWLEGEARPLVFFCRSGARSLRAVQCVRRAGYKGAWHLAGGLALAGDLVDMRQTGATVQGFASQK
jgi:rhodanese-related sulfurtransferase